jgi:hypothetical protein
MLRNSPNGLGSILSSLLAGGASVAAHAADTSGVVSGAAATTSQDAAAAAAAAAEGATGNSKQADDGSTDAVKGTEIEFPRCMGRSCVSSDAATCMFFFLAPSSSHCCVGCVG